MSDQQLVTKTFRVNQSDFDRLKIVARHRGSNTSELVRRLVERELDRDAIADQKKSA